MKTQLLKIITKIKNIKKILFNLFTETAIFFVLGACVATSCDPEPTLLSTPILNRPPKQDEYPKDIAFTEYSLDSTSCKWIRDPHEGARCGPEESYLIIINSTEELEKYITCESDSYPVIDFSKHTLLLARGVRCYYDKLDSIGLQQFARQNYVMTVVFRISAAAATNPWQVSIIVNKLRTGCNIELVEEPF